MDGCKFRYFWIEPVFLILIQIKLGVEWKVILLKILEFIYNINKINIKK